MIQSILVATDASAHSRRALAMAADLAGRYAATLRVLHVIRDMQVPPELRNMAEVERLTGQRSDVLRFVSERILKDAKERARAAGAKSVQTATREGDPASAIVEEAASCQADLVVMGTRGLGSVKGALMGSVSRKVGNLLETGSLLIVK